MRGLLFYLRILLLAICGCFFAGSVTEAAYGPYVDFEVGSYTRRVEETNPNFSNGLKFLGTADSTRLLARIGLDLNFLDIYATLGGATLTVDEFDGYHGKMGGAFGGGFKMVMYESPTYERFKLFINPDIIYYKTNDTVQILLSNLTTVNENHEITWTEYEVRVGGSARYDMVEPYGGVKLSFLSGQETGKVFGTGDIKERDNVGLFLGAHYFLDPSGRASIFGEIGGGDNGYFKIGIKSRF